MSQNVSAHIYQFTYMSISFSYMIILTQMFYAMWNYFDLKVHCIVSVKRDQVDFL